VSSVLRSRRAVLVNVEIMRAFVAVLREAGRYETLGRKLAELERTQKLQGEDIHMIFDALRKLEATTGPIRPRHQTVGRRFFTCVRANLMFDPLMEWFYTKGRVGASQEQGKHTFQFFSVISVISCLRVPWSLALFWWSRSP